MASIFSQFKFKYKFRDYQARALSEIEKYLENNKIHIVAAPGAGKTALALQKMIDIGEPALILVPTIALREQWKERFKSDFSQGGDLTDIISDDLNAPKLMTVITYQSLYADYAAITKKNRASVIACRLREANVKVIILDEAHHLKAAWLDATNDLIKKLENIITIALTATPPYDMKQAIWRKYIDLCGDIDIEITVPELIDSNDLAEHQDYILFNYPNQSQLKDIESVKCKIDEFVERVRSSEKLIAAVSLHDGIIDVSTKLTYFISNFDYYLAMLKFLHFNRVPIPKNNLSVLDASNFTFTLADLEILLSYCLGNDSRSYSDFSAFFREVRKDLKSIGAIVDRKVNLRGTEGIKERITQNIGKLNSIRDIIEEEKQSLGNRLKLVIISENIYASALDLWDEEEFKLIGVIPVFAMLVRKKVEEPIVLTGEIIIIPAGLKAQLYEVANLFGVASENVSVRELGFDFDYARVNFSGSAAKKAVAIITALFEKCDTHVLVGTSALIGEGWDAPFINALIMATSISSFVTSNQVRGRAIRTCKATPDKAANIWHLVCVEKLGEDKYTLGQDYKILKRRFEAFEGVGVDGDLIDHGIERLNIVDKIYSDSELVELNKATLNYALERDKMRTHWLKALKIYQPVRISKFHVSLDEDIAEIELIKTRYLGLSASLSGLSGLLRSSIRTMLKEKSLSILTLKNGAVYFAGNAILQTLKHMNIISESAQLIFLHRYGETGFFLQKSTIKENSIFREAYMEMLSEIDNPRFIIKTKQTYFAVPDIIGTKKENADFLLEKLHLTRQGELIFTRSPDGKVKLFMIKLRQNNVIASWHDNKAEEVPRLMHTDVDIKVMKSVLKSRNLHSNK